MYKFHRCLSFSHIMLVDVPPPPTPSHVVEEEEPTRTPLPRYGFIFVNIKPIRQTEILNFK